MACNAAVGVVKDPCAGIASGTEGTRCGPDLGEGRAASEANLKDGLVC